MRDPADDETGSSEELESLNLFLAFDEFSLEVTPGELKIHVRSLVDQETRLLTTHLTLKEGRSFPVEALQHLFEYFGGNVHSLFLKARHEEGHSAASMDLKMGSLFRNAITASGLPPTNLPFEFRQETCSEDNYLWTGNPKYRQG
jgi:hypothetical protein